MKKFLYVLLAGLLVAACNEGKVKKIEVLSYDADPEQVFSFNERDGSTIVQMAKYTPDNPDYEQMYWLGGDLWIGTDKKFYPGDTLTLGDLCSVGQLNTIQGNQDTLN